LEQNFIQEGGLREAMTRVRLQHRNQPKNQQNKSQKADKPNNKA
jgi:hypothetical protein